MTHKEAKEILTRRYQRRGYPVVRIRRLENSYLVTFGQDKKGKGLGPGGLSSARCNVPTGDRGAQLELPMQKKKRRKRSKIR